MPTRDDTPPESGVDSDSMISERRLRVVNKTKIDQAAIDDNEGDYNLRVLLPIFGYIRDKFGQDTLNDIIHDCGLPANTSERKTGWISHERFEHLLASTRELVESDEEFLRASAYEMKKQYGAFVLVLRCMTMKSTYDFMARAGPQLASVATFENIPGPNNSTRVIYRTTKPESRLVCLSRQGPMCSMPTLFLGMPPAKLVEHACVAWGDDRCEYELSWNQPLRYRLLAAGMLVGGLIAAGLPPSLAHPSLSFTLLPLLGAATGAIGELRRLVNDQANFTAGTLRAMEEVVVEHAQATDELTLIRERERDWNRHVEEGVAARTRKLNAVVDRLRAVIRRQSGSFPVVHKETSSSSSSSHKSAFLSPSSGDPRQASVEESAVDRVSKLVGELVNIASDNTKRNLEAEEISIDNLVAQLRRQLKATMLARNVRITVFQTREAPATIVSYRQILDRVIDNVLLNASRHTDRGSVVVEASGTPGSLLLKLSDTGSGISKERLEQVFEDKREGSGQLEASNTSNDRSGLAYAAGLLDHIGGRLEIMSEPGVGTTLWIYIPTSPPNSEEKSGSSLSQREEDAPQQDSIVGRVVRIRSNLSPSAALDPDR